SAAAAGAFLLRLPKRGAIPAMGAGWVCGRGRLRSWRTLQNQRRVANLIAAMTGNQRDFRILHLTLRGIGVAELTYALDDLQHALDMGLRQLAAGRVGGKPSTHAQRARLHESPAFALGAKAVIFELHENHIGEAVIELRGIDVV